MPVTTARRPLGLVATAAALALSATACGAVEEPATPAAEVEVAAADTARAQEVIAPLTGQPTQFPISTALAQGAQGKRIAYMDCGSPICGLFFTVGEPAAKALGMELTRIKTGLSADSVSAAFDSVVQADYDGVFVPAIQPSLWERGLDQLVEAGIPVVTSGIVGADRSKVAVGMLADQAIARTGEQLAAHVVATTGDGADVVFYLTPEIAFNPVLEEAFTTAMGELCPGCSTRSVDVPAAALGTRAPALITDDLQANPDTTNAVFAQAEMTAGLPQALGVADIDIDTTAVFPDPQSLQLIKTGDIDSGLGIDIPVVAWTLMDSLARLTTQQEVADGADDDIPPVQLLTAEDLPGDVSRGWTGYPDYQDRFTALWTAAG